jgi:RluA family pseudouridine synthase
VRRPARLKEFLASALGISGNKAKDVIDTRNVLVNNRRVWIATHELRPGDVVELAVVPTDYGKSEKREFTLLYEDDRIIAVNKPPGLISDRGPDSVEELIRRSRQAPQIRAIHRLDRDTSGVFLLARDTPVFEQYRAIWSQRKVKKVYLAICFGVPRSDRMTIRSPIEGKSAVSNVTVLKRSRGYSLLEIEAITGRTHQIRIHLNAIHHPVVGDKEYGAREITDPRIKSVTRQMLHCYQITLGGELSAVSHQPSAVGRPVTITAPIPADFRRLAARLGLGDVRRRGDAETRGSPCLRVSASPCPP